MNQNYETVMKVPVRLTDVPDDVRVTAIPIKQITVSLSGKGTALRKSGRRGSRHVINIRSNDFNMAQGRASLSSSRLKDSITSLLPPSVSVRSISPDSLLYLYQIQRSVMLPVEYEGNIESQDQYFLERIDFNPDSICAKVLLTDTMPHRAIVEAGAIVLSSDTIIRTVPIKSISGVLFSNNEVEMRVISQQYTEKSIEVPITGVNFPEYISLKAFPSKATLTVWVKMSEYDSVTASDFQVVVDYNDIAGTDASKARLRIFTQPANVRNVRLQTRTVDYLMESRSY
jgi:hypothetical protein